MPASKLKPRISAKKALGWLIAICFALVLAAIVVGLVEIVRIIAVFMSVNNAARFAIRYAVVDEFEGGYCASAGNVLGLASADLADGRVDCMVPYGVPAAEAASRALINWARIPSIKNAAYGGADEVRPLKIVVCSGRAGYFYDRVKDACFPREDAGEPGGKIIVSVIYEYHVGSSVGADFYTVKIHSFKEGFVQNMGMDRVTGIVIPTLSPTFTPTTRYLAPTATTCSDDMPCLP